MNDKSDIYIILFYIILYYSSLDENENETDSFDYGMHRSIYTTIVYQDYQAGIERIVTVKMKRRR